MRKIKFFIGILSLVAVFCLCLNKNNEAKADTVPSVSVSVDNTSPNPGDTLNITCDVTANGLEGYWKGICVYIYITNPENVTVDRTQFTYNNSNFSNYTNATSYTLDTDYYTGDEVGIIAINICRPIDASLLLESSEDFSITLPITIVDNPSADPVEIILYEDEYHELTIGAQVGIQNDVTYSYDNENLDCPTVTLTLNVTAPSGTAGLGYLKIDDTEYTTTSEINSILTAGVTVPATQDSIKIEAEALERGTITSITGPNGLVEASDGVYTINLNEPGTNSTVTIKVTSQNEATEEDFILTVKREAYAISTLDALNISLENTQEGEIVLSPTFASDTKEYTLSIPEGATTLLVNPTITPDVLIQSVKINNVAVTSGEDYELSIEGLESFNIVVEAQDKSTTTYTISLERKADDASLKSLTVKALNGSTEGEAISLMEMENNVYIQTISYTDATGFKVYAVANSTDATIEFSPADSISFDSVKDQTKTITITVTSGSGIVKIYTVQIIRTADDDNTLKVLEFNIDDKNYIDSFSASNPTIVEIPASVTTTTGSFYAETNSINAEIISMSKSVTLPTGTDVVVEKIIVKAANGETLEYTIRIMREDAAKSDNNIVDNIEVTADGKNYIEFNVDDSDYEVVLPYNISTVTINVTPQDTTATIKNDGPYSFNYGEEREIEVYLISERGTEGQHYTIKITRTAADTNAYLTDLKVDGVTIPDFNSETPKYEIRVEHSVSSILISATAYELASITSDLSSAKDLDLGKNTFTITVLAQDNTTTKLYTLIVYRAEDKNTIENITISNTDYVFDASITNPDVIEVPYSTQYVDVTVSTDATYATITGAGTKSLKAGENTLEIYATSEYGTVGTKYTIIIKRSDANKNTNLSNLEVQIDGVNQITFDKETTVYKLEYIDSSVTSVYITATPEVSTSTVTGIGNIELPTEIEDGIAVLLVVKVTAEYGNTQEYKIYVSRGAINLDDNNDITNITISSGNVVYFNEFNAAIPYYTNNTLIPYYVESVYVTVTTPSGAQSTVTGAGWYEFNGENIISIQVYATSAGGNQGQVYTIVLTKEEAQSDASLEYIKIDGTLIEGFDSSIYEYTMHVNHSVATIDLTYKTVLANTSVEIQVGGIAKDGYGLELQSGGQNIISIIATAEDNSKKVYTVNIIRASEDGILSELYIDGVLFHKENDTLDIVYYSNDVTTYYATVSYAYSTIEIIAAASDTTVEIRGIGEKALTVGKQEFQVAAIPQEGNVTIYNIIVVRKAQANADTATDEFSIVEIEEFATDYSIDENIYTYEKYQYAVASNVTELTFNISFNVGEYEETPTYEIIGNNLTYGKNLVIVTITASDKTSQRIVVIEVERTEILATSARIDKIESFSQDYANDKTSYSYTVKNNVKELNVEFTLNDSNASYEVSDTKLEEGKNNVIKVTIKNGEEVVKVIELNVYREKANITTSSLPIWASVASGVGAMGIMIIAFAVLLRRKKRG